MDDKYSDYPRLIAERMGRLAEAMPSIAEYVEALRKLSPKKP